MFPNEDGDQQGRDDGANDHPRPSLVARFGRADNFLVQWRCRLDRFNVHGEPVAAPGQRLDVLVRSFVVAQVSAQQAYAAVDGLVAGGSSVPHFVDQLVARNEFTVASSQRQQHRHHTRFGFFLLLPAAQDTVARKDFPVSDFESLLKRVCVRHSVCPSD